MRLPSFDRQRSEMVLKTGFMTVFINETTVPNTTAMNVSLKPLLRKRNGVAPVKQSVITVKAIAPKSVQKNTPIICSME